MVTLEIQIREDAGNIIETQEFVSADEATDLEMSYLSDLVAAMREFMESFPREPFTRAPSNVDIQ